MQDRSSQRSPMELIGHRRWGGIWFGVAAMGAASGVTMVLGGAWAGWFLVVVFGPSAVVLALALRPQSNTLAIDDDGYTVHSVFRSTRVPWSDVERVGAVDATHGRRVAIRFTASRAGTMADAAALAAALGGFHCILPLDYGIGADDVAELMRQRASRAR